MYGVFFFVVEGVGIGCLLFCVYVCVCVGKKLRENNVWYSIELIWYYIGLIILYIVIIISKYLGSVNWLRGRGC